MKRGPGEEALDCVQRFIDLPETGENIADRRQGCSRLTTSSPDSAVKPLP
jgi:hypothetical protein